MTDQNQEVSHLRPCFFISALRNILILSKTACPRTLANGLGALVLTLCFVPLGVLIYVAFWNSKDFD